VTSAAAEGDIAEIRRLLAEGVDPDRYLTTHGTPLGAAARAGELAAVRVLVEAGADVNRVYATRRGSRTALAEAIEQDETAVADYLRGRGAIAEAPKSQ
jgi:ankyrin repeat protein